MGSQVGPKEYSQMSLSQLLESAFWLIMKLTHVVSSLRASDPLAGVRREESRVPDDWEGGAGQSVLHSMDIHVIHSVL